MRRTVLSLVLLLFAYVDLSAQGVATFHVFPVVADGRASDGTYYASNLVATNVGTQPATCTYRLYGNVSGRISGSSTFSLRNSGSVVTLGTLLFSGTELPLANGYGTLTCSQPVAATLEYFCLSRTGTLLGATTVFSSPPTARAELVITQGAGFRTAVGIANDTDSTMQYQLTVLDPNEQQVALTTISIPARSNSAEFIDELVRLPNDFGGTAFITSTSSSFSVVGLVFNGSVFFSQPAVTFGPTAGSPPIVPPPSTQGLTGVYYLREYTTFCCDSIPAVAATGHFVPPFRLRGSSGDASDPMVTGGMLELRSDFTFSLRLDLQVTANGTNASWQANGTYTAPTDGVVGPEFELRSPAFWTDVGAPGDPTWDEYVKLFGDPRKGSVSIHDGDLSAQFNFQFGKRIYNDSAIYTFRR